MLGQIRRAEAATEGSEEDFKELADSIERMKAQGEGDQAGFIEENRTFHNIIARASGNTVLETFWGAISLLANGEHHGMRYSIGNRQHVIAAHQRILDACRKRHARAASTAMAEHVGALEHLVHAARATMQAATAAAASSEAILSMPARCAP